jgi:hypothetical protein
MTAALADELDKAADLLESLAADAADEWQPEEHRSAVGAIATLRAVAASERTS